MQQNIDSLTNRKGKEKLISKSVPESNKKYEENK